MIIPNKLTCESQCDIAGHGRDHAGVMFSLDMVGTMPGSCFHVCFLFTILMTFYQNTCSIHSVKIKSAARMGKALCTWITELPPECLLK